MPEPIHIFIDTSTFEEMNFDWSGTEFHRLRLHVEEGRAVLHSTKITVHEVRRRISSHAAEATKIQAQLCNRLKKLGKHAAPQAPLDAEKSIQDFDDFLSDVGALVHDAAEVDCEEVMDRHISMKPPFSKEKPNEFADAVAGISLRVWAAKNGTKISVVAEDGDWRSMCDEFDEFEQRRLGQVLEALEKERAHTEFMSGAEESLQGDEGPINEVLEQYLCGMWPVLMDRHEDGADASDLGVQDLELHSVDLIEVEASSRRVVIALSATATVTVHVRYGDDDYSYRDEGEMHFVRYLSGEVALEQELKGTVEVVFDKDFKVLSGDVLDLNIGPSFEVWLDEAVDRKIGHEDDDDFDDGAFASGEG